MAQHLERSFINWQLFWVRNKWIRPCRNLLYRSLQTKIFFHENKKALSEQFSKEMKLALIYWWKKTIIYSMHYFLPNICAHFYLPTPCYKIKCQMPCPSMGAKWFWTVQIILVEYQWFWMGPIHFSQVQIILDRSKL